MLSPVLRRCRAIALVCFLSRAAFIQAQAQQPVEPWKAAHFSIAAKDLYDAASAVSAPEGANISILDDEDSYTFDESGRVVHVGYFIYKILTAKAAEGWDSLAVGWEPWHQARPEIRGRVVTPNYAEHLLDAKTITEAPAREGEYKTYSDGKTLRAPLPAIAQGAVVEEEYIERETQPLFPAGHVGRTVFGRELAPVAHSHVELDAPASLPLRTGTLLWPDVQPVKVESNGRVKLTYDIGRLEGTETRDSNLPPDVARFPELRFSTGASWQAVAAQYGKDVDARANPATVQGIVNGLVAGKTSQTEKEAAIVDYLDREVRYTGIEFSEAAIIPHDPAETLGKKYGDCKDKATLLVTMLRAAGIPAYVALLNAGSRMDVPAELPGMGLFDHAIVYVPGAEGKTKKGAGDLWIDATDQYARLGQLPMADQGRLALVARAETTELIRTPESTSKDNVLLENRELKLSDNGPASVTEKTQPMGVFESMYRASYADKPDKDTRENLLGYVKAQYVSEKLTTVERTDPGDLAKQFELTIACEKARRGYTGLTDAEAAIRYDIMFFQLPEELRQKEDAEKKKRDEKDGEAKKPRTADWELSEPFSVDLNYRIVPPLGFVPKNLPKNSTIQVGPAVLTQEFSAEKSGAVIAHLNFDSAKRRYTVAEATELRNKVADLIAGPAMMVSFEPEGQALLRDGKVREALASYRGLIAKEPGSAVHHLQVASVLLDAGMGEAARAEARVAVKLDPKSALAEKTLAQILERDLVGRNLRAGSDLAGAVEAYRKAVELDPDDTGAQGDLAILLEYDPAGRRYSRQARMKDAIAEYQKLGQDKLDELGLGNNMAFAQFYGRDFAGSCKSAQTLNPEPKALIASCVAALQGSKAGLAEVNKRSSDDKTFKDMAKTAGEMLMNVREYPLAADFLQAGAAGDNAAQTMGLASLLRNAPHHEEIKLGNTPADAVKRFMLLAMEPNVTEKDFEAALSRNAMKILQSEDEEERKKTLGAGNEMNSQLARQDNSLDVTIDIFLQAFDPKAEGNDTTGYRLRVQVPGVTNDAFFVVKENGRYKVLDTEDKPNSIGLEVLDRIDAGDLAGAKALLDWLREDTHIEGGDDPLGGPGFPRFWTRGAAADARRMKLAAASLIVGYKFIAAQGVAILEAALKDSNSEKEKTNIQLALCRGYSNLDNYPALLDMATALSKQEPESKTAFFDVSLALMSLHRYDDAIAAADQRLKLLEGDADAIRMKMQIEANRGNPAAAIALGRKLVDMGKGDAEVWNEIAWFALFTGKTGDADIAAAIKATQLATDNPHILHTLACLYADTGKTKEAREVLLRSMDDLNLDEPNDDYWYAFGRIAEQYGERDIATADYKKLKVPKEPLAMATSSYVLAQARLKAMNAN